MIRWQVKRMRVDVTKTDCDKPLNLIATQIENILRIYFPPNYRLSLLVLRKSVVFCVLAVLFLVDTRTMCSETFTVMKKGHKFH